MYNYIHSGRTGPCGTWGQFFYIDTKCRCGQLRTAGSLFEGRGSGTHRTGGCVDSEPVWTRWRRERIPTPAENRSPVVQPEDGPYIDWAIPAQNNFIFTSRSYGRYVFAINTHHDQRGMQRAEPLW